MEDIEAFLAVIEAGSQTAAARRLGRSLQSVNRSLAALERSVARSSPASLSILIRDSRRPAGDSYLAARARRGGAGAASLSPSP